MPAVSAVLIPADPGEPVRRVTVDGLAELQAAVGGDIEAVDTAILGDRLTSYINADGKFNGCQPNPRATELLGPGLFAGDFIAGPLLVCGFDPDEGENRDCPAGFEAEFLGVPRPLARPDYKLGRRPVGHLRLGPARRRRRTAGARGAARRLPPRRAARPRVLRHAAERDRR